MKYGVFQFSTDYAIRIDDLAREAEARGFESLFVPEHTHIPASRKSPWPGGADLPREYWHTVDPFVGLAAAAAVTTKLKLGTGICLVIERDPIVLAKEVASLDYLSRGRVLFGIGGGWNAEEMAHHGTDFENLWSYPKPVQKPHPPILMGGAGPHARQRAVDFGGHWLPIGGRSYSEPMAETIADLRARAEKAGQDPGAVTVSIFGAPTDEARLAGLRDAGVLRAIFGLPPAGRDQVLPLLDKYAALAARIG